MKTEAFDRGSGIPVWPSFADVALCVALIMVLYMVAHIAISGEAALVAKEIMRRQEAVAHAVRSVLPTGMVDEVGIKADGNIQRFTFSERVLFESGRAALLDRGEELLHLVGPVLRHESDWYTKIQIEGHTDDRPLRSGSVFPSNWELSSARATTVVRFLQDDCGMSPDLLSATGYSMYQPARVGDYDAARASNRRVELVLFYSTMDILLQISSRARE